MHLTADKGADAMGDVLKFTQRQRKSEFRDELEQAYGLLHQKLAEVIGTSGETAVFALVKLTGDILLALRAERGDEHIDMLLKALCRQAGWDEMPSGG